MRGKYDHYLLQGTTKSRCPQCKGTVDMLARGRRLQSAPSFYICWPCKRVWQIGKAPVQRLEDIQPRRIEWQMPYEPTPTTVPDVPVPPKQ